VHINEEEEYQIIKLSRRQITHADTNLQRLFTYIEHTFKVLLRQPNFKTFPLMGNSVRSIPLQKRSSKDRLELVW